jgi:acetyl-CoA carboxylase carboxyltransferase component
MTFVTHNWLETLNEKLQAHKAKTYLGGGEKSLANQRSKGKMTARERIDYLVDDPTDTIEIGTLAADGMYVDEGGCPSAGVVVKIGSIAGKRVIIVANDASVKAGAWFPMTAKKNLRAQEIALENELPIVYLVDSAGVFLPLQHEVFADKEHFGRIFRNNAVLSAKGIVQIAAIMGSCVAGGAYLPIMSDEALIVDGTGIVFLAGSYLVKAAIGEDIDNETLGGSVTQTEISGVTDNRFPNDSACLDAIKKYFSFLPEQTSSYLPKRNKAAAPALPVAEMGNIMPADRTKPYDMIQLLSTIMDADSWIEYKPLYGKTIVCGFARIEGLPVGIVANQRKMVKSRKGEMQMGGVIYSDSADKASRFIMNCNQRKIPLLFVHDVTGFMVGSRSEQGGIIKDGAKMVSAVANSVVPKITLVVGNSYGAGNYAMCGKAYDPRFIFAWPSAQIAVMGAAAASGVIAQIQKSKLKGTEISPDEDQAILREVTERYTATTKPEYAAARIWIDDIINPNETRHSLATALEVAGLAPITARFNVGVIQT